MTSQNQQPTEKQDASSIPKTEQDESRELERLGRERPKVFKTMWSEIGFCFAVVMSQFITEYFVSGFTVIIPVLVKELNIPQAAVTWPASAFSLVVSTTLLPLGRLGDMYGGYPLYVGGCVWYAVWSLVAGFAQNQLMLDFCRALQGLGPAAFLPAAVLLLGSTYRPGPRKNIVFSTMGAMAPLGFFAGIFFAGVAGQYTTWRWYFFIGTILVAMVAVVGFFCVPSDIAERRAMGVKMDWLGSVTTFSGLILLVFAITAASHAPNGWKTPYILVTLILGVIILAITVYIEGWVAEMPILPADVFRVPHMKPLVIGLLFSFGSLGIYLLYATLYMTDVMGGTPMQLVAWYVPFGPGAVAVAIISGYVLHIVPGTFVLIFAGVTWLIAPLLFALAPTGANYWAWTFPAMLCATLAVDTTINITTIFISTSMPKHRQGLAGALVNSIMQLGIALLLGFADVVVTETGDQGTAKMYKNAFWLEVGCAGLALIMLAGFVKIGKAESQLTAEEQATATATE
ncbi:MFS general substrate transporter [Myriangium duriaei CBS 260.36]|uniref:MFS general substrate transporter n=1 Tax=Myriangium duriaei CBS 260.36 TaxID=1168546 RepID=A0A9P4MN97_9PEZI|nr:MFS general substrate transporter [Myriangium duriaei CBS 260.36]